MSLTHDLSKILGDAFVACGYPFDAGAVRFSDRPDLAQFQCNGAMAAAKAIKANPRAVAEAVVSHIAANPIFQKVEIAGPGFINLTLTDDALADETARIFADARCGVAPLVQGDVMILDYGGPNIAKAMHVGHLRTSIIGESLRRLALFCGYRAIGDVHMGDWGTQIGMVISEFERRHPEWIYFNPNVADGYPADAPFSITDLEEVYPFAAQACKDDEARKDLALAATLELQNGRPGYRALWRHIVDVSVASMKANFDLLDVHFDWWNGESSVHELIAPMVAELEAKGYAVKDQGAVVIPVAGNDDQKEMPPLILYKRDGAVMYGTTDLATILDRMPHNPTKIVYIVDQRQSLHFEQVFRAAYRTGIATPGVELIHAGNGTMNGTDGKPFKTRAGGVLRLEDLIETATSKAKERMQEANLVQDNETARRVGVAALKFADLQNQRQSDYIFDIDRMTAFEGKTGPYMLYQAVRIKSLMRKAAEQGVPVGKDVVIEDASRSLVLLMHELPDAVALAMRNYTPHVLCDYVCRLANAFSSFYGNCQILSEQDHALRAARLALCASVLAQLELVLGLLGISVPEQM